MTRDPVTVKEAVALMGAHTIGKVAGFKFINNVNRNNATEWDPVMFGFTDSNCRNRACTSTMNTLLS